MDRFDGKVVVVTGAVSPRPMVVVDNATKGAAFLTGVCLPVDGGGSIS